MRANLSVMLAGALAAGHAVAAAFFARFWRDTKDRLFVYFAIAFGLMSIQLVLSALLWQFGEAHPLHYLLRLAAFLLLIVAIVEKNRTTDSRE